MQDYLEVFCSKCGTSLLIDTQIMTNGKARVVVGPCLSCMHSEKQLRKAVQTLIQAANMGDQPVVFSSNGGWTYIDKNGNLCKRKDADED